MIGLYRALKKRGVLGINRRNANYIMSHNPRKQYPLVDDKVLTKQLAIKHGVPVPELYGVIYTQHQAEHIPTFLESHDSFVIKPSAGSGGDGILVISHRRRGRFGSINGLWYTEAEIDHHISNVLTGMYSLGGIPDKAMFEALVLFDPFFKDVAFQGIPDMRIIVYKGIPVMAMVRLPTRASNGKANLHQGAIGVGIDLASGKTIGGVFGNEVIAEHPDTGASIAGLRVPYWQQMLEVAANAHLMTGLGYLGVDLVLDRERGPLMLELNARPGLNIQIANRAGLESRLRAVDSITPAKFSSLSVADKIELGCSIASPGHALAH